MDKLSIEFYVRQRIFHVAGGGADHPLLSTHIMVACVVLLFISFCINLASRLFKLRLDIIERRVHVQSFERCKWAAATHTSRLTS